jgi:hypothetical protein
MVNVWVTFHLLSKHLNFNSSASLALVTCHQEMPMNYIATKYIISHQTTNSSISSALTSISFSNTEILWIRTSRQSNLDQTFYFTGTFSTLWLSFFAFCKLFSLSSSFPEFKGVGIRNFLYLAIY